ncbi:hypothetical protein BASA50_000215 [Batrachochytrium salamandrivorans]|uniref:Uncharacterized protein n=1 Tax=Batrachochytrium salamandrivorans TaxID=1357716 RepID=A0ABQ8EUJ9_9FUNG|nr:hypothetical protein BASA50_000215 [Batrachochytrium salamandrivorans]KAH9253878.1 hypothetical protein BASA81_008190 [Batrachochytrium salamandrivorans]
MKFKALVVAAMVIASVNAKRYRKRLVYPEENDKKSSPVPLSNSIENDQYLFKERLSGEEKPADDSNGGNAKIDLACKRMYSILKDLQTKIREFDDESYGYWSTLRSLENKINSLKAEEKKNYSTSYNEISAKLKVNRKKSTLLKKEYCEVVKYTVATDCGFKTSRMISTDDKPLNTSY